MSTRLNRRIRCATPVGQFHLFSQVPLEDLHNLQRRLVYEAASRDDGRIVALFCEHEPLVTIGRGGSRADVRLETDELVRRQLEIQYVARGGGAVLHGPGQLALYIIAPLVRLRWTVGDYVWRLQSGISAALDELHIHYQACQVGLRGRSGILAALGIAVRHGIASHGAALNIAPHWPLHRHVLCISGDSTSSMGSLLTERADAGRMAAVRSTLIVTLARAFGCDSSQMFSGHPLLPEYSLEPTLLRAA